MCTFTKLCFITIFTLLFHVSVFASFQLLSMSACVVHGPHDVAFKPLKEDLSKPVGRGSITHGDKLVEILIMLFF